MSEGKPAPFDAARHIEAMVPVLGLVLTPEQLPGVLQFLGIAREMAVIVASAPLDDGAFDLAPVFRPGSPETGGAA